MADDDKNDDVKTAQGAQEEPRFATGAEVEALLEKYARERIGPRTRMQCKVCWYVYDPEGGCLEEGIEPGTPFYDVPDDFVCPECGHPKTAFLPLEGEGDDEVDGWNSGWEHGR